MIPAVYIQNLKKTYRAGESYVSALNDVSFSIQPKEVVAIVGESGSGKSTLLHILGALDTPTSGTVQVGGINPFDGDDKKASSFRNRYVGFVFQQNNLLPEFTALENVMMPGLIAGRPVDEIQKKALNLLDRVGLQARQNHPPSRLSGGEQQRVAVARALINDPVLVLADEPSGSLDSTNAALIHNLLLEMNALFGSTVVVITHNQEFAAMLPRRIRLRDGCMISDEYDNDFPQESICKVSPNGE